MELYIYKLVLNQIYGYLATKLKGMTFDHDFSYYFLLFSSLFKKEGRRKGE